MLERFMQLLTLALWFTVVTAAFISAICIWFLLDPPPNSGGTTAIALSATAMWLVAFGVMRIRRAYRRRN